jgi:Ca2+-binding EF-hand superfamily protein
MPVMEILPDAHALFRALDADGDGKLTKNEILAGFRRLGLPTQAADVNRMMAAVCICWKKQRESYLGSTSTQNSTK